MQTKDITRHPTPARASLTARARGEIRDRILRGDLPVGAVLSRRKIARDLEMSVPPVTEALQQLERDGLVESRPRAGTRVRVPTRQDVEDRALVREALETQAARLFSQRATVAEKKELSAMGRTVDRLYTQWEKNGGDRQILFSVNTYHMKFHLRIAEGARCSALRDAIEKEQTLIFNWLFDTAVGRRGLGAEDHARLADALATCSPQQSAAAMRTHIRHGLREVLRRWARVEPSPVTGWRSGQPAVRAAANGAKPSPMRAGNR